MDQKGLKCILFLITSLSLYLSGLLLFKKYLLAVNKVLLSVLALSRLYYGGENGEPQTPLAVVRFKQRAILWL